MKHVLFALVIAAGIYGLAVGVGSLLYVTGAMPTGATHNDCDRAFVAKTLNKAEDDLTQPELKAETQKCLDEHQLTEGHAFRTEYLIWSVWPALVCAVVFLTWPAWSRILRNQEDVERDAEAARLEMGT